MLLLYTLSRLLHLAIQAILQCKCNAGNQQRREEHNQYDGTGILTGVVSGIVQELLCGEVLAACDDLDDCKIAEDGRHGKQRGNQNTRQHIGHDDAQERIQLARTQNLGRFDQLLHIDCAQIVADA